MSEFQFTNTWFTDTAKNIWDILVPSANPSKILEIGSFEGASTCYLIEKLSAQPELEIHCIDTWEGGIEHQTDEEFDCDMQTVEARFHANTRIAIARSPSRVKLEIHKGFSDVCLSRLLADGKGNYFDFVYVDGSHQAPDVICDAVLGFRLLKVGGTMVFDDYLWAEHNLALRDPIRCPKPAVDAFTNLYCRKIELLMAPLCQLYVRKMSD